MSRSQASLPLWALLVLVGAAAHSGHAHAQADANDTGTLPVGADGKPLNLDFEAGTLKDWKAEGSAFAQQPVQGDTVAPRRSDMASNHQGNYWVGSFERHGDPARGTLTSVPFTVTQPWASFLVAGGVDKDTAVELVREDTQKPILRVSGDQTENLKRVIVDLKEHQGKPIFIRVIDQQTGGWGHINFDDFRFHAQKPKFPARADVSVPDVYAHNGLSPEEAARAMTVPQGFSVALFAGEPDVVQPIAMTIDERGRLWVAEAYSYPIKLKPEEAKDRILIFEDTNNDGKFDTRKIFADHLNLVSGLEVGFGGVFVGAAPELLFIPDANHDDQPDGPPQVLLDGWAMQDTHETLNSFIWGPDGWLYGCHGVFTFSRVGKPGTPDKDRTPINAGIWRYHPTRKEFEVFSHGTSNPWGVDFDPNGQCFIEACVIPHLYHMIQHARYERQAGSHDNPYTYDDIKTIADHRHYVGANPHGGNGRSDEAGGGHAHSGLMIYDGGRWPKEYVGGLYMNNIHGARLNHDVVTPAGSGFVGSHRPDFLLANDSWSQVVYFRSGPDGNAYMIDWYDKNQCHRNETEMHDRTNGRIFKISFGAADAPRAIDLGKVSSEELVSLLGSSNNWYRRTARRLLMERGAAGGVAEKLSQIVFAAPANEPSNPTLADPATRSLEALWALGVTGGLDEPRLAKALTHSNPYIRAWAVQFACENRAPSPATLARMAEMAGSDPSPIVRLYLASAAQRLPDSFLDAKWSIVEGLSLHGEDARDPNLPLMTWYALEPLVPGNPARALSLGAASPLPNLLGFVTRRVGSMGTPEAFEILVKLIDGAESSERQVALLEGLAEALKGRRDLPTPKNWDAAFARLRTSPSDRVKSLATGIGVSFGDPRALADVRAVAANGSASRELRSEALASLIRARDPELPTLLYQLLEQPGPLRAAAIRGLAAFENPKTPAALVNAYKNLSPAERRDALSTLAARPATAKALLDAVENKSLPASELNADLIRNLRNLKDESLNKRIAEVWGQARETTADKAEAINKYRGIVRKGYVDRPDPVVGRMVYSKTCGQCHVLFGTGGQIGPDLTGSNRADLDYVLSNVIDPSALVGKDYQATIIATTDGRTLTGIVKAEDPNVLTLVTATETLTLPITDIEDRKLTELSLMPEDQWVNLSDHEIRSLVAYLAGPSQVPLNLTAENAANFFNGKDLAGWVGDRELWKVEEGEIVGKTAQGIPHNAFLYSDITATDFRLTLEIKLVNDEGNSGIQFRSEPLPDGEMKGPQADAGPGWWGKLYEENGRALLWDRSAEANVKKGDWNTYVIEAVGPKIRTSINGKPSVDLTDEEISQKGVFALQLHSGGPTEVRFRNLKLEPIVTGESAAR